MREMEMRKFERQFSMSIFALSLKGHVKGYERKRNVEINLKWSFFYPDNVFTFTLLYTSTF